MEEISDISKVKDSIIYCMGMCSVQLMALDIIIAWA